MDLTLVLALGSIVVLLSLGLLLFVKSTCKPTKENVADPPRNRAAGDAPRRVRNQRARLRVNAGRNEAADDENNDEAPIDLPEGFDEKIGAKKRAKLEAKAEKKHQREIEEKAREDKKKREQLAEEERLKQQEKENVEEKLREEEEKRIREEKERREHEEYLKMKEAFSVEEEGFEEEEGKENTLQEFINYIKHNKVIVIEDIAAHFKLKTQAVIDRIQDLIADNTLSGVVDDRGKFIYISQEELQDVAKFIKQRGRVSITELAENSNKLINLNPSKILV